MTVRKLFLCVLIAMVALLAFASGTSAGGPGLEVMEICFEGNGNVQMYGEGDHGGWGPPIGAIQCPPVGIG